MRKRVGGVGVLLVKAVGVRAAAGLAKENMHIMAVISQMCSGTGDDWRLRGGLALLEGRGGNGRVEIRERAWTMGRELQQIFSAGKWVAMLVPAPFEDGCHAGCYCAAKADDGHQDYGGAGAGAAAAIGLLVVVLNWVDVGGQEDEREAYHKS
ncbi:hypothetical protein CYMTET_23704 [Cymbomonas tetramitiformis]|uniref:Uncharacterized protein n=1 Tax=Cymbomonas tetramitiformis TaxID=36881 RepID=A0AAE0FXK3_9CHLO|nr:hypothetical protein CYMTET_23704 [Cymbomonas tetramitiformis]